MRGRVAIGLAPMVQGQETMDAAEQGQNPLQHDWGAVLLDKVGLGDMAKWAGGDDYQRYLQAKAAFEAQLMPIQSGAAVSPSEAQRQIAASLPEFMDTVHTLHSKSRDRKMVLNGMAHAAGSPLPYPDLPTFGVNTTSLPQAGGAPQMPPPVDSSVATPGAPPIGTVEDGFQFKGGNPGDPANWVPAQ
jgi:hypothetical protein